MIARPHIVDGTVSDQESLHRVAERRGPRPRHHDVVETALRPDAVCQMRIPAHPGVAGIVAHLRPAVVEHEPGHRDGAAPGDKTNLVTVGNGVQVAAEQNGWGAGTLRPKSGRQSDYGSDLLLPHARFVEAIGKMSRD